MKISIIFLLLSILYLTNCSFNLPDSSKKDLETRLQGIIDDNELIGLSSVYFQGDEFVYQSFLGSRDQEGPLKTTQDTFYRIASISKVVTTSALMTLYDKNLIDLDQDISEYLGFEVRNPGYPNDIITLRHVLSHTSSINDGQQYDNFVTQSYQTVEDNMPVPKLQDILKKGQTYYTSDVYLDHQPGEYFTYCNLNFVITGTIIESVTGQRFDKYVKENVLKPLGIQGGFNLDDLDDQQFKNLAGIYKGVDSKGNFKENKDNYHNIRPDDVLFNTYQIGTNACYFGPQGGLRTSAINLHKFSQMLYNKNGKNEVLSDEAKDIMMNSEWQYDGDNGLLEGPFLSYGQGMHISTGQVNKDMVFKNKKVKGHSGDAYGLISNMYFDTSSGKGYIFITNGSKKPFGQSDKSYWYKIEQDIIDLSYELLYTYKYVKQDEKDNNLYWIFIVVGLVLLFIGGLVGFFYLYKKQQREIRQKCSFIQEQNYSMVIQQKPQEESLISKEDKEESTDVEKNEGKKLNFNL